MATIKTNELQPAFEIIQCPKCQTKFGVESSLLDEVETPKFHCSRCDHLFALNEEYRSQGNAMARIREVLEGDTERAEKFIKTFSGTNSVPAVDQELSGQSNPRLSENVRNVVASGVKLPGTVDVSRNLEDFNVAAPHEMPVPNLRALSGSVTEPDQIEFDFSKFAPKGDARPRTQPKDLVTPGAPTSESMPSRPRKKITSGAVETPLFPVPGITHNRKRKWAVAIARTLDYRRPTATLLAVPVIFCLALLAATSLVFSFNPKSSTLLSGVLSGVPGLAPSGVHLKGVQHRVVLLDSGEQIELISGKIVNESEQDLKKIFIEGAVFNRAGDAIARAKVNAASTVADLRVRTLTPTMIREIQELPEKETIDLAPGTDHSFAVALLGTEVDRTRYFAARIYSVGATS